MNILFIAPRFHTNQYEIIKSLKENDHKVSFFVNNIGFIEDHSIIEPKLFLPCFFSKILIKIFNSKFARRSLNFPNPIYYYIQLKAISPNVVIIRDPSRLFSFFGAILSRILRAKIIFYSLIPLYQKYTFFSRLKYKILLFVFDAAWQTPLEGDKKLHKYSSPPTNMFFVPFAVPSEKITHTNHYYSKTNKSYRILMTGKYHSKRKNHFLFIDAIHYLSKKYSIDATIIGERKSENQKMKYNELKKYIENLQLENIKMISNVDFRSMKNYYQNHDFFVLPASNEPAGFSVLEAIANGIPAICSSTCGVKCYIQENKNGLVFTDKSLNELISKIEYLLANKEELSFMKDYCWNYSSTHFSRENYYSHFIKMINNKWKKIRI